MEENEKDNRVGATGFFYFINNFQIASYLQLFAVSKLIIQDAHHSLHSLSPSNVQSFLLFVIFDVSIDSFQ